jgi:hypothetical protein
MLDLDIQLYNGKKDNTGTTIKLGKILQTISGPSLKPFILTDIYTQLQAETDPAEKDTLQKRYDAKKGQLPAVTWSGTFTTRKATALINYTGFICLDIDKVNNVQELKEKFAAWHYTSICFISPSGAGIKVIVQTAAKPDEHKAYFLALQDLIKKDFDVNIDPSGKDINRLCFLCHDSTMVQNKKAATFVLAAAQPEVKAIKLTKPQQTDLQDNCEDLYSVIAFTDKVTSYTEGNRNNYIHLFACNANRKGFSLADTIGFASGHFTDQPTADTKATINSAYAHNTHEHAKYKKQMRTAAATPVNGRTTNGNMQVAAGRMATTAAAPAPGENENTIPGHEYNADTFKPFWRKYKFKKGTGADAYDVERIDLNRVDFSDFLFDEGFHLLPTGKDGYQMCHSGGGIIKPVDAHAVKQYVLKWCRSHQLRDVEEMLRKGQKQYFAQNELDSLPYKDVEVKKDTKEQSFFYFKNCWVSVTENEIKTHDYSELTEYIWEGNKIDKDFTLEFEPVEDTTGHITPAVMSCEFAKFIYFFGYNPKNDEEKDFEPETINERFWSIATSYGFLLDSYKHPAERKGIFAIDHKIGDKGEQNGRTGKSIIPQATKYLKKTITINGKNFKADYQFKYEPITRDAQIVNFNDMQRNFDVEQIFEVIADDYSVIRRSNGYVDFTYYESPKVFYSTNFTPNGEGSSYAGRMHVIEASDYFSDKHSPYAEFNHSLFTDWDPAEWNRFFNFSLQCVQALKTVGLVAYPKSNFDMRKLIGSVVPEFIDFMDVHENCQRNTRVEKIELLEKFNTSMYVSLYGQKLKPHTFHKWVKQYAKNKMLQFNPHKNGSFDKSNGKEYYLLANEDYKPEQTTLL